MNNRSLEYSDISLTPNYSELESRSKADTKVSFGGQVFNLPIIPANMVTTINADWATWLSVNGYFYIMHRFGDLSDLFQKDLPFYSISLGVNEDSKKWLEDFGQHQKIDYITIDIAHGHHLKVKEMIRFIRSKVPNTFIIAGNIATRIAAIDLASWGADAVKVGIGGGKVCSTALETGFHTPMFSTLVNVCIGSPVPVIADGGIRHNGDITKALVAGATMVMAGSIFANCIDSPAPISWDGRKEYWGSASFAQKGEKNHIEGTKMVLDPSTVTLAEKMVEIRQALQSSISYAGGFNLAALNAVKWTADK